MDLSIANGILAVLNLAVSARLFHSALVAFKKNGEGKNRPVAIAILLVGFLFLLFAVLSVAVYTDSIFYDAGIAHSISRWRSLLANVIMLTTGWLMIGIFEDKI